MPRSTADKGAILLFMTVSFLGGYLFRTALPWFDDTAVEPSSIQVDGPAIKLYAEALGYIEERAMFPTPVEPPPELVALSLKAYLAQKDPFSGFLTAEEYLRFRKTGNPGYAGIGLDIEKRRDGTILGYPLQKGPAARAGIGSGDQLLAIDGIPLHMKSLPAIAALVAGEPGTKVVVEFSDPSGARRQASIIRAALAAPAVSEYTFRSTRIIKLPYFTPDTRRELHQLLSSWNSKDPIIIDLRGCGGGDFYAAVDSAMLFLAEGETIVSVRDRSGVKSYSATMVRKPPSSPVYIWQDEFSASAAEIFIAALTENGRAISVGRTSAGKGTRQDIIELQEGGALILTTGYLITPRGGEFEGRGLAPMRRVEADSVDTAAFFNKTAVPGQLE